MPKFSVLDLAPVREGGSISEAFRNTLELAQNAERWGYNRFWMAEHHNMAGIASAATSVLIGYVAGGTETLRVGSGGIMLPNHSSLVIAEQFGTLETLYPGRIDLGIGRAPGSDGLTKRVLRRGLNVESEDDFPRQVQELLAFLGPVTPGQPLQAVPGGNTNVPVWLLGSSTYSAQLAAMLGLPFAFAAHFAPQALFEALRLYRENFRPSKWLAKAYAMVCIPLVAATTDAEAKRLATSPTLRFLKLIRGEPIFIPPPVDSLQGLMSPQEEAMVHSKFSEAIIGGPETLKRKLKSFLDATQADEIMIASELYSQTDRLRSYRIAAGALVETFADSQVSLVAGD